MAKFVPKNVVKETTATVGAGTYVLGGAVPGYDPFSVCGAGSKVAYKAENAAGSIKEVGIGTVSVSPNQITRDEILRSPSGSPVSWTSGAGVTITLVGPAELLKVTAIAPGPFNCRLAFISTTQIALQRCRGANLPLVTNGVWRDRQIPSAGVTLGNGGLAANTTYYVYAFWNGSAIALEASTTGHAEDADTGIECKSGDSTRLLVGLIRTEAGSTFQDSDSVRYVLSYFCRRVLRGSTEHAADVATSSTSFVELAIARRVLFLNWGDESVSGEVQSHVSNSGANGSSLLQVAFDGTVLGRVGQDGHATAGGVADISVRASISTLSEANHHCTQFGRTSGAGTSTYYASKNITLVEIMG